MPELKQKDNHATRCLEKLSWCVFKNTRETTQCKETTTKSPGSENVSSFHIFSVSPDYTKRTHTTIFLTLLQEVKQCDYLGLRLDPMMNMKAAAASILEKANKCHSLLVSP